MGIGFQEIWLHNDMNVLNTTEFVALQMVKCKFYVYLTTIKKQNK